MFLTVPAAFGLPQELAIVHMVHCSHCDLCDLTPRSIA